MIESIAPQLNDGVRWHAILVRPRHEKSVAKQLERQGIEFFLPLYRTVHRWKDRRKMVHLPLFPGYLFVHVRREDRLDVLRLEGVARFVGFSGAPAEIPRDEINALRSGIAGDLNLEPHPYLRAGERVRVRFGPLAGVEGALLRKKGILRIVLCFQAISQAVAVEVDACDVESTRTPVKQLVTVTGHSQRERKYGATERA